MGATTPAGQRKPIVTIGLAAIAHQSVMRHTMGKKRKTVPSELEKPITWRDVAWAVLGKPKPGEVEDAIDVRFDRAVRAVQAEKLLLLISRYGISEADPTAFAKLALNLAIEFHPAFKFSEKRGRGRPPRQQKLADLLNSGMSKKPGRPRTWYWHGKEAHFLKILEAGKKQLQSEGKPVTNEAAIFSIFRSSPEFARSSDRELRAFAKSEAKRVSDAKKAVLLRK
jgi:hypothetical protein